jgi:RNA polymerase sigma-70 factor, ECF subfamily
MDIQKTVKQHACLVYSLALRILRHASTAEEVVQDIFLRVWRNADSYDHLRGPFLPWLLTLSRNKALDHLQSKGERQRRRENQVDEFPSLSVMPGFEATVDKKRQLERVRAAIETLQPEQRRAIELAYFEELTHSEIAAKLHTPLGTIKGWIRNGMMDLKEKLLETTSVTGRTKRLFLSSNMAKNREDYPDCG